MTSNYFNQIDRIVKTNKLYRFKAEIEDTDDEERKIILNNLVIMYNAHKDEKQIKDDTMKAYFKVLKFSQYQKKWQLLTLEQKMNRMEEYIKRNVFDDNKTIKFLNNALTTGVLKTKDIKYDIHTCQIEIVSIIVIDEGTKKCKLKQTIIDNII